MFKENQKIFCKCCGRDTKHMDMGNVPKTIAMWKCMECGEYNQQARKINPS